MEPHMNRKQTFCDGLTRRDCLRLGVASSFGLALNLPAILRSQAAAAETAHAVEDRSLIFLFLHGGLSKIDTWDMKPAAPTEFRGEFNPIDTVVPGIQICEHLPRLAKQM